MPLPVAARSSARQGAAASSSSAVKAPAAEAALPVNPPAALPAHNREMGERFNPFDRENDLISFIRECA